MGDGGATSATLVTNRDGNIDNVVFHVDDVLLGEEGDEDEEEVFGEV